MHGRQRLRTDRLRRIGEELQRELHRLAGSFFSSSMVARVSSLLAPPGGAQDMRLALLSVVSWVLASSLGCDATLTVGALQDASAELRIGEGGADSGARDANESQDGATYAGGDCRASAVDGSAPLLDIVFIVDNTASRNIVQGVADRIAVVFPQILEASGVDYRVIMLSRYGSSDTPVGRSNTPV